jgi:hypothetical protein
MTRSQPGHEIVPQPGTAYTQTSLPADLTDPGQYPAEAFCLGCRTPAQRASIRGNWRHRGNEDDGAQTTALADTR